MTTTAPSIRWSLSPDLSWRPRVPSLPKQQHHHQQHQSAQTKNLLLVNILAGYTAGVTGTLVGYPLDSLKVWQQTGTMNVALDPSKPFQACRALYRGVASPLLTVGLVQSVYFSLYDATRQHLASNKRDVSNNQNASLSLLPIAQASAVAGFGLAVLTQPLLILKTQQQVHGLGFTQALSRTTCWTRGMGPHVFSETLSRIVYMTTYEAAKHALSSNNEASALTLPERMVCAAGAGMLSWSTIFPLDVIRNRLYASQQQQSAWQAAKQLVHEAGIRGLYRGFGVTVLRAGPVAAAVLPIYDLSVAHWSQQEW